MPVRAPFGVARGSYESPETVPWIREQDWSKSAGFAKVWWVIWIEMWSSFGANWMMSKRRLRGNRSEWLKKVRKWMHGCVKSQEIMKIGEETFDWRRVWVIWLRRICIESAGCCWFGMQIWVVFCEMFDVEIRFDGNHEVLLRSGWFEEPRFWPKEKGLTHPDRWDLMLIGGISPDHVDCKLLLSTVSKWRKRTQ